ncbi:MAG: LysE family transporter [Oscillospiraceae bacterium]
MWRSRRMKLRTYAEGLRFGMMLQLTVGPVCLLTFHTAQNNGFLRALALVLTVTAVDAFYILLASVGVSRLLSKNSFKVVFRFVGAMILMLFGMHIVLGVFGIALIPALQTDVSASNIVITGLVLTLSNPLTIIFWGGVFTAKLADAAMPRKELMVFALGLISSTFIFLSLIGLLGTMLNGFIPHIVSDGLNLAVGAWIVFFGGKLLLKKTAQKAD